MRVGIPHPRRPGARPDARSAAGFTLIEVLVAVIVIVVGILGTITVISNADTTGLDAELHQVATDQAEKAIERVRSLDYSQIGHTSTPAVPSGEPGLSGNNYQSPDMSAAEQLVIAANSEPGDPKYSSTSCASEDTSGSPSSSATACFAVGSSSFPQVQSFTVDQGDGRTITGQVHTIVTWRDEECGALPITELKTQLATLSTILGNRISQLSSTSTGILSDSTYGLNVLLDSTLPIWAKRLKDAGYSAGGQIANAVGLLTLLQNTKTTVDNLSSSLSGLTSLDVCDLRLAQFKSLKAVTEVDSSGTLQLDSSITTPLGTASSGGTLGTRVESVRAALQSFKSLLGSLTVLVCPNVLLPDLCTAYDNLNSVAQTLSGTIGGSAGVYATTDTLRTDLQNLTSLGTANTTHNTKRVTVAVTIDKAREDMTPDNVVYLESVVIDPNEGLVG